MKLTNRQLVILQALWHFKFLTTGQLQRIFNWLHASTINTDIRKLKGYRYPLLRSLEFGVVPGKGRLARVHFLTRAGKNILVHDCHLPPEQVQMPGHSSSFFQRDYFHRLSVIDFNILYQRRVASEWFQLKKVLVYFNKQFSSNHFQAQTCLQIHGRKIEPDAIGIFEKGQKTHCVFFEQHNSKDAQRVMRQIRQYRQWLNGIFYSDEAGPLKPDRILFSFEHPKCMESVRQIFEEDSDLHQYKHRFLFKPTTDLKLPCHHSCFF